MRALLVVAAGLLVAACGPTAAELQRDDEDSCRDAGNIVLWSDPSDQRGDTMMIGCIPPEQYAELFDTYTKIEEVSDD